MEGVGHGVFRASTECRLCSARGWVTNDVFYVEMQKNYSMRQIPPLKGLIAFDAAMRLGSFSAAAMELSVTPGAVGQQIQKLEEWLGLALFARHVRQVTPTAEGRVYFAHIQPALSDIIHASRRLRERQRRVINLSMPPSFAAKWFAPRMTDFLTQHPGFSLSLNTSTTVLDFDLDAVDLAIRYFGGEDPRLSVQLLYRDEVRPYCSPAYRERLALKRPGDLRRATLLHHSLHAYWHAWLKRFSDLSDVEIDALAGLEFDQGLIVIDAAAREQGIVLTSPILVEAELASGALVPLFDMALPLPSSYYLVHPPTEVTPGVQSLKLWFMSQMGA